MGGLTPAAPSPGCWSLSQMERVNKLARGAFVFFSSLRPSRGWSQSGRVVGRSRSFGIEDSRLDAGGAGIGGRVDDGM